MTTTNLAHRNRRLWAAAILTALLTAGVALITLGVTAGHRPNAAPLPAGNTTAASLSAGPLPAPTGADATVAATPIHQSGLGASSLRIPALDVTATIGRAEVTNGILTPPLDPDVVGAWAGSAGLAATTGEVTLAGHVNWTGMKPFAFARLAYLHPGNLVYTSDATGAQTAWRITTVTARPKTAGVDPAAFRGTTGPRTLALITCGGPYDPTARSYDDNIYITATPA